MKNHDIIYLQTDEDGDQGRIWCQDRVYDDDVVYIRADLVIDALIDTDKLLKLLDKI